MLEMGVNNVEDDVSGNMYQSLVLATSCDVI
jgi:hypothetical protein